MLQKGTESGEKRFSVDDDVDILSIFDIFCQANAGGIFGST